MGYLFAILYRVLWEINDIMKVLWIWWLNCFKSIAIKFIYAMLEIHLWVRKSHLWLDATVLLDIKQTNTNNKLKLWSMPPKEKKMCGKWVKARVQILASILAFFMSHWLTHLAPQKSSQTAPNWMAYEQNHINLPEI